MAQYEEAASKVLSDIRSSGLTGSTKDALAAVIGSTGNVVVQDYDGSPVSSSVQVVRVKSGVQLNSDPGSEVVLMDAAAPGANVTFNANAPRLVVGGAGNDVLKFEGNADVTVETGGGNDNVATGGGDDQIIANGSGDVTVVTGAGNDEVILQGEGTRVVNLGGSGDNTVYLQSTDVTATVTGGDGFDRVVIAEDRSNHTFQKTANGVVMHSDKPTTLQGVEVVDFVDDQLTVLAATQEKSVIAKLYQVVFDRDADLGGIQFWLDFLDKGNSLEHTVYSFINSAEFNTKYANVSNESFINSLYENMAGRSADAAGVSYWMDRLAQGETRQDVAWAFAESAEATEIMGLDGSNYVIDLF